jgi:hypothetical protein
MDIAAAIADVYAFAARNGPTRSVTELVVKFFETPQNPAIVLFVGNLARASRSDPEADLFRQFLLAALPAHAFLFVAEVRAEADGIPPKETRPRVRIVQRRFGSCGWQRLPKTTRQNYEGQYCADPNKLAVFCLALYEFCVGKIETMLDARAGVEAELKRLTRMPPQEIFAGIEFMKAISSNCTVKEKELAVFLSRNSFQFENLLASFDHTQSPVITAYERFPAGADSGGKAGRSGKS